MDGKQFNILFPNDEAVIHYIINKCFNGIIKCQYPCAFSPVEYRSRKARKF